MKLIDWVNFIFVLHAWTFSENKKLLELLKNYNLIIDFCFYRTTKKSITAGLKLQKAFWSKAGQKKTSTSSDFNLFIGSQSCFASRRCQSINSDLNKVSITFVWGFNKAFDAQASNAEVGKYFLRGRVAYIINSVGRVVSEVVLSSSVPGSNP